VLRYKKYPRVLVPRPEVVAKERGVPLEDVLRDEIKILTEWIAKQSIVKDE
jgi:hypothetical protein